MTKRDYERAAQIVQRWARVDNRNDAHRAGDCTEDMTSALVELFASDNPRFDEARFRAACVPGANVKARPRKVKVTA